MKIKIMLVIILLFSIFTYSQDCQPGYEWAPRSGVGCRQIDCDSVANAHYSYTQSCVCGSSGSIQENPSDPNKECIRPFVYTYCPGCVYACVHSDEPCPDDETDQEETWDWQDYPEPYNPETAPSPELFPDEQTNFPGQDASLEELHEAYVVHSNSDEQPYANKEEQDFLEDFFDEFAESLFPDVEEYKDAPDESLFPDFEYELTGSNWDYDADENPFEFPGGRFLQDAQDWFSAKWEKTKKWHQGDLPFTGEDGAWNWKSTFTDSETGEKVVVKWVGVDLQMGWNKGFKIQIYIADVDFPDSCEVNGYTVGMGLSADWRDKVKIGLSVPGTPVSITVTPRDIKDDAVEKGNEFIEFIRSIPKKLDIIGNAQEYQQRKANE